MPYYEWRGSGVFRDAANDRTVEQGDVVELTERQAGNHDFVEVDEPDDNPEDADDETGAEDADDAETETETGAEDIAALADEHWKSVVNAVEEGEVDDSLEELEAVDDRSSVQEAVAARRDELND